MAHILRIWRCIGLAAWLCCAATQAQPELQLSGQVDFGYRFYQRDGLFAGQTTAGPHLFLGAELSAHLPVGRGDATLQFSALNEAPRGRAYLTLTRAHYSQAFGSWDLLIGSNVENWAVAESRSVLNVLNPGDVSELAFGGAQTGTPMINANVHTSFGTISAFALVGFTQPVAQGARARHRALWPTNNGRAIFQDGNGRNLDFALRFTGNYALGNGSLDIAAAYFNGTSRAPVTLAGCADSSATVTNATCDAINTAVIGAFESGAAPGFGSDAFWAFLAANASDATLAAASALPSAGFLPYYQKVQHVGLSAVYANGDLQLRFEAAWRKPKGEAVSFSGVIGGDYTWPNIGGSDATLTLALEYLYADAGTRQPQTVFENDVFLGLNLQFGDQQDTRLSAGGFYDLDSHAQLYQLSLSSRINDALRAELNAVQVYTQGWNDPLAFLRNDNFVEFRLSAYF